MHTIIASISGRDLLQIKIQVEKLCDNGLPCNTCSVRFTGALCAVLLRWKMTRKMYGTKKHSCRYDASDNYDFTLDNEKLKEATNRPAHQQRQKRQRRRRNTIHNCLCFDCSPLLVAREFYFIVNFNWWYWQKRCELVFLLPCFLSGRFFVCTSSTSVCLAIRFTYLSCVACIYVQWFWMYNQSGRIQNQQKFDSVLLLWRPIVKLL